MISLNFHPATVLLLRLQARGRRRRMWQRFCQPRRLVLSAVAGVLAIVWLGNAAMTVWLRRIGFGRNAERLLSLGIVLYATWHFAKAAFFRPESPFEWSPADATYWPCCRGTRRDLVSYQIASVCVTTTLKTGLLTLLLLPDLRCVPLAMVGLLLAMMMLEMLRMAIDIATWGMSRAAYLAYRIGVVTAPDSRRIRRRQPSLPRSDCALVSSTLAKGSSLGSSTSCCNRTRPHWPMSPCLFSRLST